MALKICIATPDAIGPIRNGGVGTACTALAQELALAGHHVTLFYTLDVYETGNEASWQEYYRQFGIDFVSLPSAPLPPPHIGPTVYEGDAVEKSYRVYEYLKVRHFDVIHFPDYLGHGYFSAIARRQGLAFANTRIWVTCHAPSLWSRVGNRAPCDDIAFHVRDRLERGLVEHCDLVLSPSQYMLDWLCEHGWRLPERSIVLQNLFPRNAHGSAGDGRSITPTWQGIPKELVFFGRLETRKGLQIFCDAIDRLVGWLPNDMEITFLGKRSVQLGEDWLGARVKGWPFGWKILDGFDSFQAMNYLRGEGRLAVMPSLADNSPYCVLECLVSGIPFLATDVGGVGELIEGDHAEVLCQPTPIALAEAITRVFQFGTRLARPARTSQSVRQAHLELHGECAAHAPSIGSASRHERSQEPLVSVCILHRDRGADLAGAIASIRQQTYQNVEIVVVDNGSRCQSAIERLDQLEQSYDPGRLTILRLPDNVYEPKARNAAAEMARGEFLLFMDDDNRAKPFEIEYFVRAARHTGADVYTCFADHFDADDVPDSDQQASKRFLVIGDAGPVGLIFNAYGDVNFLIRRDRFMDIAGFVEDGCYNHAEDWRFLARAYLRGLTISVVPEALFWYKAPNRQGGLDWRKRDRSGALYRAASSADGDLRLDSTFLLLAQGLFWRAVDGQREIEELKARLREGTEELAAARAELDQQRRMNDHARETLEALQEGFRQVVKECSPDPRAAAIWTAAGYRVLPYVGTLPHRADGL